MSEVDPIREAIAGSGLVSKGERGVVLVSGGADSVSLLTGLAAELAAGDLLALHVNYGLRPEAGRDEELVRRLCGRLGVELQVLRAGAPEGNLQAWARELRLGEAERLRRERGLDWIAVGHTRTDQVETFIYRLASSPGVRPLLAMPARSGHVIRPLLGLDRAEVRRAAEGRGIEFNDDATNESAVYARNRIRHEVVPALEGINPSAEANIARTRAELEEDEDLLIALAGEAIAAGGLSAEVLVDRHPALLRRMLRLLAETELGRPVTVNRDLVLDARRLAASGEGGRLDLGRGDQLVFESGRVRIVEGGSPDDGIPEPAGIGAGDTRFGSWTIRLDLIDGAEARAGFGEPMTAFLDAVAASGAELRVRTWRTGDRIDQLGLDGSKSLQDAFTDRRVPRSERDSWPVVTAGGEPIWVPGLAVSRHYLVGDHCQRAIRLRAAPPSAP